MLWCTYVRINTYETTEFPLFLCVLLSFNNNELPWYTETISSRKSKLSLCFKCLNVKLKLQSKFTSSPATFNSLGWKRYLERKILLWSLLYSLEEAEEAHSGAWHHEENADNRRGPFVAEVFIAAVVFAFTTCSFANF